MNKSCHLNNIYGLKARIHVLGLTCGHADFKERRVINKKIMNMFNLKKWVLSSPSKKHLPTR